MNRTLVLATLVGVALAAPAAVEAQRNDVNVRSDSGDIRVTVNGDPVEFTGARPMMRGGRVTVPVRGVFERLGGTVQWMPEARAVSGSGAGGANPFRMEVNSRRAFVNDRDTRLDAAPRMVNGAVYVPLRFVSEALGGQVTWDDASRTVAIVPPANAQTASAAPGNETAAAGTTGDAPSAPAASPPGPAGSRVQPTEAQPAQQAQPAQAQTQPAQARQVERQPTPVAEERQEDRSALGWLPWVLGALALAAVLAFLLMASRNRGQVIAAGAKGGETGTRVDDPAKRSE